MDPDLDENDDESFLADLLTRYEESLADAGAPPIFDLSRIEDNPALLNRWHSAKTCLDLMYRVRQLSFQESVHAPLSPPKGLTPSLLPAPGVPQSVGRFQIERLLGTGGVGLVYLARDSLLGRYVALKVPRLETLVDEDLRTRFLREAEAAARLSHPNVVSVLETGQDDSLCYIAAEYCEGPSLAEWLHARVDKVPVLLAATLVRKLSDAVQHAHSRGVLHRDIKPSNVMLVDQPSGTDSRLTPHVLTPKLTDFGMAKLQEALCEETRTGATIGTPTYMAPEQAAGRVREIGSQTDVYALGAVLYELLTGQPPLRGETPVDTLRRVLDEDPTPVRRLRADVPLDLEAICLKCLAKSPSDRYQTAQQLADDLNRYLAGEPISARPPNVLEHVWKWSRRHPLVVGGLAISACSLLALLVVISVYNSRLIAEVIRADEEAKTSRRLLYSANVHLAQQSLLRNNVPQTLQLLQACLPKPGQEDLREFSWHYVRAGCDQQALTLLGHTDDVFSVAYSPDGAALASAGKDGTVRIWNATTGESSRTLRGHTSEVTCVAFSPSGHWLASGSEDHTVRIWDWQTGSLIRTIGGTNDHVLALAFSPDGKSLAVGGREPVVRVWNLSDWSLVKELSTIDGVVRALQFAMQSDYIIAADEEGRVHSWSTGDWSKLTTFERKKEINFALSVAAASPLVATAGRRETIEIFSREKGELQHLTTINEAHQTWIQSLAFNPDNNVLASADKEGVIRLWSPETWRVLRTIVGHSGRIWSVAWSPNGQFLASAGADGQIRIWESEADQLGQFPIEAKTYRGSASLDTDDAIISCSVDGVLKYWSTTSHRLTGQAQLNCTHVYNFRLSPDKTKIAIVTYIGQTEVWLREPLTRLWTYKQTEGYSPDVLAWSDDGSTLASQTNRHIVTAFDATNGHVKNELEIESTLWDGDFLPDNSLLISTGQDIRVWDHVTSKVRCLSKGDYHQLTVSQDGRYVATVGNTKVVILDTATGEVLFNLVVEGEVHTLAISPDNRTLVAGVGLPNQVEFWDLRTGRELISIPIPGRRPRSLFFTADGKHLFAELMLGPEQGQEQGQIMKWSARKTD